MIHKAMGKFNFLICFLLATNKDSLFCSLAPWFRKCFVTPCGVVDSNEKYLLCTIYLSSRFLYSSLENTVSDRGARKLQVSKGPHSLPLIL
jgi:hypothetical protein